MTIITTSELDQLQARLLDEQREIHNRLTNGDHYGLSHSMRYESGELSTIDNHPGDTATELYERAKDVALAEQEELHLERIEAALSAIQNGSYGICKLCSEPIPFDRLDAVPDTLYCKEHAPRQQISHNRPIEEAVLAPPFGRTSLDEHDSFNGFDGEDAWQIVEHWGNSDSPAMSENRNATDYEHLYVESDDPDGYVEPLESFLATDITGRHVSIVRNREYDQYIHSEEGDHELEIQS